MVISVKVITGASKNRIKNESGICKVYLTARPVKGKANEALLGLMAEQHGVKKRNVKILRGEKSNRKLVEILFDK